MHGKTELASFAIALISSAAVFTDIRSRRIPNWLTAGSALAALFFFGAIEGWAGLAHSLVGAACGLILFIPLFIPGWVGAGDAKLLMALGAWGGLRFAANVAVLSVMVGAGLAVVQLLWTGRLFDFLRRFWSFLSSWTLKELEPAAFRADRRATLPFAVPIAVAAIGRNLDRLPEVVKWLQ